MNNDLLLPTDEIYNYNVIIKKVNCTNWMIPLANESCILILLLVIILNLRGFLTGAILSRLRITIRQSPFVRLPVFALLSHATAQSDTQHSHDKSDAQYDTQHYCQHLIGGPRMLWRHTWSCHGNRADDVTLSLWDVTDWLLWIWW